MTENCDPITIRTVVVTVTSRSVQLLMVESDLTAGMSLSLYTCTMSCTVLYDTPSGQISQLTVVQI